MANTGLKGLIVGLLLILFVGASIANLTSILTDTDSAVSNKNINVSISQTFVNTSMINKLNSDTTENYNTLKTSDTNQSVPNLEASGLSLKISSFFGSAATTYKVVTGSAETLGSVAEKTSRTLMLPAYVWILASTLLFILLTFAIITLWTGVNQN